MKKGLYLLVFALFISAIFGCCSSSYSNSESKKPLPEDKPTESRALRLSILGDSYSTFVGYVKPDTNYCWYGPNFEYENNVKRVEECWWHQLAEEHDMEIVCNNSFSGATISNRGYDGADYSDRSFLTRSVNLGEFDLLLVFGGTNDSWAGVPIGEYKYENWTSEELYEFRPAFAALLSQLKRLYPRAYILNITNSELSPEVTTSMAQICEYYGVKNLLLEGVDKQWGHPSVAGMRAIKEQVERALLSDGVIK